IRDLLMVIREKTTKVEQADFLWLRQWEGLVAVLEDLARKEGKVPQRQLYEWVGDAFLIAFQAKRAVTVGKAAPVLSIVRLYAGILAYRYGGEEASRYLARMRGEGLVAEALSLEVLPDPFEVAKEFHFRFSGAVEVPRPLGDEDAHLS